MKTDNQGTESRYTIMEPALKLAVLLTWGAILLASLILKVIGH